MKNVGKFFFLVSIAKCSDWIRFLASACCFFVWPEETYTQHLFGFFMGWFGLVRVHR